MKYKTEDERLATKRAKDREYYRSNKERIKAKSNEYYHSHKTLIKITEIEGEEWKPLVGWEGLYEVSNLGRIKSLWNGREIDGCFDVDGYRKITLTAKDGKQYCYRRPRLVAITWIPNPENKSEIDHINTIRTDDRVDNLRWVTSKENQNNPETLKHMSEWQKGKTKEEVRKR